VEEVAGRIVVFGGTGAIRTAFVLTIPNSVSPIAIPHPSMTHWRSVAGRSGGGQNLNDQHDIDVRQIRPKAAGKSEKARVFERKPRGNIGQVSFPQLFPMSEPEHGEGKF
jgi:hypothetical protein